MLVYPHSWPSLGTMEAQWLRILWQSGEQMDIPIASANLKRPEELARQLDGTLSAANDELANMLSECNRKYLHAKHTALQTTQASMNEWREMLADVMPPSASSSIMQESVEEQESEMRQRLYDEALSREIAAQMTAGEQEMMKKISALQAEESIPKWMHVYAHPEQCCKFFYDVEQQRFRLKLDRQYVKSVELSEQLAYMLGFPERQLTQTSQLARYIPDMRGGMSSFFVYAPGLIEPVFIGDVCAPVLRIVNIRGAADEQIEECYVAIQYHKVIMKEISEILIEIRTASGSLMPFQYGMCCLTLHFRKIPYF